MKSLYIKPQKTAKNPIRKRKYRICRIIFMFGSFSRRVENIIKTDEKSITHAPCPTSPYITPKRKGNVTMR